MRTRRAPGARLVLNSASWWECLRASTTALQGGRSDADSILTSEAISMDVT